MAEEKEKNQEREDNSVARNQGHGYASENYGGSHYQHNDKSADSGFSNSIDQYKKPPNVNADIMIIEKKTGNGLDQNIELGEENTTKVGLLKETTEMDHDLENISDNILGSKNGEKEGSGNRSLPIKMSTLSWNCRGLGSPWNCQFLMEICLQKHPF